MSENTKCIRCGKIRINAKSWTEQVGSSLVTFTTTVCPDTQCQKLVECQLQARKDKLEALQRESYKRREHNKELRTAKRHITLGKTKSHTWRYNLSIS